MLNFDEELAKFQPVKTMDTLSDAVREELEKKDIISFLMEVAEQNVSAQNASGHAAKPAQRTAERGSGV